MRITFRIPHRLRGPARTRAALLLLIPALAISGYPARSAAAEIAPVDDALELASGVAVSQFNPSGYPAPIVPSGPRAEDSAFEGAVLIGASTAQPFSLLEGMPPFIVLSLNGLSPRTAVQDRLFSVEGKKVALREKVASLQPRALYLWLGTNGLDYKSADSVLTDYGVLLNQLVADWPDIPIYLMAMSPVKAKLIERIEGYTNEKVVRFNEGLLALAEKHNLYYLPIHPLLCDTQGELGTDYGAGDGLHLRAAAYRVLAEYLYTHVIPTDGAGTARSPE